MTDRPSIDPATARAYYLGQLAQDEAAALEQRVIADPAVAEAMSEAEDDLIDDYLEGTLASADARRVESVYATTPARAERLRVAREIAERATAAHSTSRTWPALALVAATFVAAAGLWRVTRGGPEAPAGAPAATVASAQPPTVAPAPSGSPGAPPASLPREPRRATLVLALTMTRSTGSPLPVVPDAEIVELQVDLENESRFARFDARLLDSAGREVWRTPPPQPLAPNRNGTLSVTVPRTTFAQSGEYSLSLDGRTNVGNLTHLADIPFAISAR